MHEENMTRREFGKEALKTVMSIAATVIGALIILSFTKFGEEREATRKELDRLDRVKASSEYVDQKCLETKQSIDARLNQNDQRLTRIEDNTQKIYDYLLNQKK